MLLRLVGIYILSYLLSHSYHEMDVFTVRLCKKLAGRGGGSGVADVAVAIPMSNRVGLSHTINRR